MSEEPVLSPRGTKGVISWACPLSCFMQALTSVTSHSDVCPEPSDPLRTPAPHSRYSFCLTKPCLWLLSGEVKFPSDRATSHQQVTSECVHGVGAGSQDHC